MVESDKRATRPHYGYTRAMIRPAEMLLLLLLLLCTLCPPSWWQSARASSGVSLASASSTDTASWRKVWADEFQIEVSQSRLLWTAVYDVFCVANLSGKHVDFL